MTILEIILVAIIWVAYGAFNSWQHDWHRDDYEECWFFVLWNIFFAPTALVVRIFRGVFLWKGKYKD